MRKLIYKMQLIMSDNSTPEVYVATDDAERIPMLIDKNKMWFEKNGLTITRFVIVEQLPTVQFTEEKYEEEISYCDIVDDLSDKELMAQAPIHQLPTAMQKAAEKYINPYNDKYKTL